MTLHDSWLDAFLIGSLIFGTSMAARFASGSRHYDLLQLNRKLDAIMAHLGIDPLSGDQEIDALITSGLMINAIKLYRETYGTGLKESKDAVVQRSHELRNRPPLMR